MFGVGRVTIHRWRNPLKDLGPVWQLTVVGTATRG